MKVADTYSITQPKAKQKAADYPLLFCIWLKKILPE